MIDCLYKLIDDDALKHIYGNGPAVQVLDKSSLIAKLNLYAQEYQMAITIVNTFLLNHAPTNKGDLNYWLKWLMKLCLTHDDVVNFYHNAFSLFPDDGDSELAMFLMTKYPNSMRDEVGRCAKSIDHKKQYAAKLEGLILGMGRGTKLLQMPSPPKALALAHVPDWTLKGDARDALKSITKLPARRKSSGKRSSMPPGECDHVILCPLSFLFDSCSDAALLSRCSLAKQIHSTLHHHPNALAMI
jgi:hypothetical protein